MIKHKNEVFEVFKKFKGLVEKQSCCSIKRLRTDSGGEFTSNKFDDLCDKEGIIHDVTPPTPHNIMVRKKKK